MKVIRLLFNITICILILTSFYLYGDDIDSERDKITKFLQSIENKSTGLYNSFQDTAHCINDIRFKDIPFMGTEKGYLDNQAFLYDNALCIIALIDIRNYDKARFLLEIFEDNFFVEKNGRIGLFNSYYSGYFDFFFYTKPGYYNYLVMGIDGDRIHIGPNMWIGLAAQHYYFRTKSADFIDFMMKIFLWASKFPKYRMPNNIKAGIAMGIGGWGAPWSKIFSTENILDYYVFVNGLIKMFDTKDKRVMKSLIRNRISIKDIREERKKTEMWLRDIGYNQRGTFNRGGFGPLQNELFTIDTVEALDVNSWAIPGLGPDKLKKMGINPITLLRNAEDKFKIKAIIKNEEFHGHDFTTEDAYSQMRDKPMIWWEGTAEMSLAFNIMSRYADKIGNDKVSKEFMKKYLFYNKQMNNFSDNIINSDYSELPYVCYIIKEKENSFTFNDWWPIARSKQTGRSIGTHSQNSKYVISVSSTIWRYFAVTGLNPFAVDVPRGGTKLHESE